MVFTRMSAVPHSRRRHPVAGHHFVDGSPRREAVRLEDAGPEPGSRADDHGGQLCRRSGFHLMRRFARWRRAG